MPNWCFNRVKISGSEKDVTAFKDFVQSPNEPFDFERIVPLPSAMEHLNEYDWCMLNWGTKWNADEATLDDDQDDYLEYAFATAWSPATGIYLALEERFPDIELSWFYDEPMNQLAGYLTTKACLDARRECREWLRWRASGTKSGHLPSGTVPIAASDGAALKVSEVGGSLRDVQSPAGHASIHVTQRYVDADPEAQRKLIERL